MKRWIDVAWVGLMVAGAVVTYAMKDSAGRAADHVHQLRADIQHEKEQINLLRASWGVVDQPARLQKLIERYTAYLQLAPIDVHQIASIDDIPKKVVPPPAPLDGMTTGAIPTQKAAGAAGKTAGTKTPLAKSGSPHPSVPAHPGVQP